MTGKVRQFIVEWNKDRVERIWAPEEWYARPVSERHFDAHMLLARDELDAYTKALKLEEQNNDS